MWIRSQKRNMLADINFMCMCNESDGWVIYCESPGGVTDRLGVYSTEEKAIAGLDEIQDAIEDTGYYRIDNIGHGTYALGKGVQVYQMPQDDEVEV